MEVPREVRKFCCISCLVKNLVHDKTQPEKLQKLKLNYLGLLPQRNLPEKKINLSWLKGYQISVPKIHDLQIMDFWIINNKPICGIYLSWKTSQKGSWPKTYHGQNGSKPFWLISQCITILGLLDVKRGETLRRKYRIICRHYWENRINYVWSRE